MGTPLKVLEYIYIYISISYIYIYLHLYIHCILYIHDPVGIVILYVKEVDLWIQFHMGYGVAGEKSAEWDAYPRFLIKGGMHSHEVK